MAADASTYNLLALTEFLSKNQVGTWKTFVKKVATACFTILDSMF